MKSSYNLILLGGTGARCGEIFVHMCANGYFYENSLNILLIDSDLNNGNKARLEKLIEDYNKCRESYRIEESRVPLFKPKINFMSANPVIGANYFKDLAEINQKNSEEIRNVKYLMKALYSEKEYNMKISEGFFARPSVGSALFAAGMDDIMHRFVQYISIDKNDSKKIKIFIIGSIFGGTGASSLPTISKYLKENLYGEAKDKLISEKLEISACMVLPYFLLDRSNLKDKLDNNQNESDEEINIESDKFIAKTKSALKYYDYIDSGSGRNFFDSLYILGHDGADVRGSYETAGTNQNNLPHIVEFYAAMSGIKFFDEKKCEKGKFFAIIDDQSITWDKLHNAKQCFFSFYVMMRFSIVLGSLLLEELFDYNNVNKIKKKAKDIPWYHDFIFGKEKYDDFKPDKLYTFFENIVNYCKRYLKWLTELHIKDILKRDDIHNMAAEEEWEDDEIQDEERLILGYLRLFEKTLLFKQHENFIIRGKCENASYSNEELDRIYKENLEYIRENFNKLGKENNFTDVDTETIGIEDIWSRLSDFGFNTLLKEDSAFKNLKHTKYKNMQEGVKNLINAAYAACMI